MNERDLIRRLEELLQGFLASEGAQIFTEYPVDIGNDLRRYIDLFVRTDQEMYVFEVKDFSPYGAISEGYFQARLLVESLFQDNHPDRIKRKQVRLYLVLSNINRYE